MATFTYDGSANINTAFATTDLLNITNTSASNFNLAQVGSNVVMTDKTTGHTITLQNFAIQQFQDTAGGGGLPGDRLLPTGPDNIIFFDGSKLDIGDNTTDAGGDNANQTVDPNSGFVTQSTNFNDQIYGFGGNDYINGGRGNDLIYGNVGNDYVDGGNNSTAGNDTVFGGQGNDTIDYAGVFTTQANPVHNELIYGNIGNDLIYGGSGTDTMFGGQGNDCIYGNDGADLIYGNNNADQLFGSDGNDTLWGGQGSDFLYGNSGDDLIYGQLGDDRLSGGNGKRYALRRPRE